jgi:molybdenum cofactor biosynthesis enzyme MoaA
LEPFDDLESVEFIKQNLNETNESEIDNLIEFFEIRNIKRRPIELIKMTALVKLKLEQNHSLDSVINDLKKGGKKNLEEIRIDDEFFELIRQKNEESLEILNYTSFLDPDFMYIDFIFFMWTGIYLNDDDLLKNLEKMRDTLS